MLAFLAGSAQTHMLIGAVSNLAVQDRLDSELARLILDELSRYQLPDIATAIEGERMTVLDIVQRVHSDDGHGSGMFLMTELPKQIPDQSAKSSLPRIVNISGQLRPTKKETIRRVDDVFDIAFRAASVPPAECARLLHGLDGLAADRLDRRYLPLAILVPEMSRPIHEAEALDAHVAATKIILALSIFRSEHGDYPDTLERLVPSILPSLPGDRYAPDSRFRYSLRAATDSDSRDYILYSVGLDGIDNGAKPTLGNHALLPDGAGTDFIFNPNPLADGTDEPDQ